MGDMFDSIHREDIPATAEAVAGYLDGVISAWKPVDWALVENTPHLVITVLADLDGEAFDAERGNASVDEVAEAVAVRLDQGKWSVGYTSQSGLGALTAALEAKEVRWASAELWPAAGCYLWAADPTGASHLDVSWAPVQPVAVQDQWFDLYDHSTTFGAFPRLPAPTPAPPAPTPAPILEDVRMFLITDGKTVWLCDGANKVWLDSPSDIAPLLAACHQSDAVHLTAGTIAQFNSVGRGPVS